MSFGNVEISRLIFLSSLLRARENVHDFSVNSTSLHGKFEIVCGSESLRVYEKGTKIYLMKKFRASKYALTSIYIYIYVHMYVHAM